MENGEGVYYTFTGFAGNNESGAGYYVFSTNDEQTPIFRGAFLRAPGKPQRIVYGRKIDPARWENDRKTELRDHLEDCDKYPPEVIRALQGK